MADGMKLNKSEYRIEHETDAAIFVAVDELKLAFWLPKKIIEIKEDYIFIPEWLWNQKMEGTFDHYR